jgi:hydroxymethylbilane synthase
MFPQAAWTELRGNVDTRLKKIAAGEADGSFLAASGLDRLAIRSWEGLSFERVDLDRMVPAAGQGAVALQCRSGDAGRFAGVGCAQTTFSVTVERLFLSKLGEGCHTAFACHHADGRIRLFRGDFGHRSLPFPATGVEEASALADRTLKDLLPSR